MPHALSVTKIGYANDAEIAIGADCTRYGLCIDACPTGALKFDIKGLSKLI